jgi:hypothetical protein
LNGESGQLLFQRNCLAGSVILNNAADGASSNRVNYRSDQLALAGNRS